MSNVVMNRRLETSMGKSMSLREYYDNRNTILIIRSIGGLGDILMHRMLFEDIKLLIPDCKIHFACPKLYHDAVIDHPYIDAVLDSETVDKYKYTISYNTSTICGRYELKVAPKSDLHRSDIWAKHCGYKLTRHNMHIMLTDEERSWARERLAQVRDREGPIVLFSPISAIENKNLTRLQMESLIKGLWDRGLCPVGLHLTPIIDLLNMDVPMISRVKIRQWMALIAESDYVISVDTSAFHCAGGLGKPLMGIFTWADGKTYGKYFDFVLVQKHRDDDKTWCGPCYNWCVCPKSTSNPKPCLLEIDGDMLLRGVDTMLTKFRR